MKELMDHKILMKNMITQLLLSVSIFSLVFSYSSLFSSSPLIIYSQKLNYYFSLDSFDQLLSLVMNKNYIFLLCNTLLFFVAKTSDFVCSPSPSSPSSSIFIPNEIVLHKRVDDDVAIGSELMEKDIIIFDESREKGENGEGVKIENEGEKENLDIVNEKAKEVSIFIAESDEEEEIVNDESELSKSCCLFYEGDHEEEEEEEGIEMMSTEELNQKFEDFIRRMKEEIRISEARQQLVVVK